ncbi:hypothetical protein JS756_00400 [Streptomyces actuosus]|uniref:Uncharacterized protein n=2 Tax=Streptomyces actuosus TaxID=1885 RepID=A0ABS2VHN4_STRAS|nr:hypothetical protein [Streptomyces actuosus]
MPARSRDIAALRRFAVAHAAAHAKAAAVRADASCWCRQQRCAAHEGTRVGCAGPVVLLLRHDPAVGQVWTLCEVCTSCAPLISHARVVGRAAPAERTRVPDQPGPRPAAVPSGSVAGPALLVPGGFSAPSGADGPPQASHRRRRGRGRRSSP